MAMGDIGSHARRSPKAVGSRRSGRAGEPPEGIGKPCRCPTSPAAPLLPGGSPARSLWVITKDLWYKHTARSLMTSNKLAVGQKVKVVTDTKER